MKRNKTLSFLAFVLSNHLCHCALADSFGSGANSFDIDFVTIGNPGNPADTTGRPNLVGSVPYGYRIGKYEISEQMIDKANALGGLGITRDTRGPNKPATDVSWLEAAKFVNWLNTNTGNHAAYKFNSNGDFQLWQPSDAGYMSGLLFRNSLAKYFLPSVDEWYKAAYYDPAIGVYYDYPTGSDAAPTAVANGTAAGTAVYQQLGPADVTQSGGLSPFGTMAQGGNVAEWNETSFARFGNSPDIGGRVVRGGEYDAFSSELSSVNGIEYVPSSEFLQVGFRVGSIVPEPIAADLLLMALFTILASRARISR